jgi:trehalose 6-phosphate phosphatase
MLSAVGKMGAVDAKEIVTALRGRLAEALIAVDFDGTLAPIVADPAASRPAPGALEALIALGEAGARLAVVTGRDAATVVRLGDLAQVPGLRVVGLYGAETWTAGELTTPDVPESVELLRDRLPELVAGHASDPGVWVEDKRLSLVVHTRRAADPAGELARLDGPVRELAAELGLEVHAGRNVLEVRLPGFDKGAVLLALVAELDPGVVLFAGDDLGDLPAFTAVRELRARGRDAWSVAATSAEVPELAAAADVCVDGPAGVVALLAAIAIGEPSATA